MEQLNAFIKKAQSDPELMEKLNSLGADGEKTDEIIALAAEYGFTVTQEDISNTENRREHCGGCSELSEEELEAVAGGAGQSRFEPGECRKYDRVHYWCVGFLEQFWCMHYKRIHVHQYTVFRHICENNVFNYLGDLSGNREPE